MITPFVLAGQLKDALNMENDLYFKREDLHPYGSHKGRSIPFMIDHYFGAGFRDFVISSSGNAALAAVRYVIEHNHKHENGITLKIFVGKNIDPAKMGILTDEAKNDSRISIAQVANPKQSAFLEEKNNLAKLLRQSNDDIALTGYEALAKELSEIQNISAIFIPTSSGTTAQGLFIGFNKLQINPQIHIVQTDVCHPMADADYPEASEPSLANAIVDKVALRKQAVQEAVKKSEGNIWIISNDEITNAIKLVKQTEKIDISPNSALAVAGLKKAVDNGLKFDGPVVCLITGL